MRGNLSRMTLIVLLVTCIVVQGVGIGASSPGTPTVSIFPSTNTAEVGEHFKINITVSGITDEESLYGWSFQLNFNPDVLSVPNTTCVWIGTWFGEAANWPVSTMKKRINNTAGYVTAGQLLFRWEEPHVPEKGATGGGTLATITFQVKSTGASTLDLALTILTTVIEGVQFEIDHEVVNGVFDNRAGENEPPVAIFNTTPFVESPSKTVIFDSASYDPDAWLVSYHWDFGDDTTEIYIRDVNLTDFISENFTTYHFYDQSRTYTVTLTVTDNDDATDTATADITVNYDVAVTSLATNTTSVKPGDSIEINATVRNEGNFTQSFSVMARYLNLTAQWVSIDTIDIFNLAPYTDENLTFAWNTMGVPPGTYTLSANATVVQGETDTDDNTEERTVTILSPPVADFTYTSLIANKTVAFNSTSYDPDGTIISWEWDLNGDGVIDATTENTTYTYTEAKDYNVTLTVTDNDVLANTKSVTLRVYIIVTHDVAITNITPSTTKPVLSEEVTIEVVAKNKGSEPETFNVTVCYNETATGWKIIGQNVTNLIAGSAITLNFIWYTTGVSPGNYTIKAEASVVVNETDKTDNILNCTVKIVIRDVTVTSVTVSPTEVAPGEPVTISVTVKNEGTEMENRFYVNAYYNESLVGKKTVTNLNPSASRTLNFQWDTTDMAAGEYTIRAVAETVPSETNRTNNERTYDGKVTVLSLPVAGFTYAPEFPLVGEAVAFNSTSYDPDETIISWEWDLNGDGVIDATTENTTYTYTETGTYTVTLTVSDDKGLANSTQASLRVIDYPNAVFTYSPETPIVGETVAFNSTSYDPDETIISYDWDFGDGETSEESNPTHVYTKAGTYTVTLNVINDDGLSDLATQSITIGRMSSTISIALSPTSITLGENKTISGSIDSERSGVTVTIWYRLKGEETWSTVTTLITDENSQYSHVWTPDSTGTYEIKASWEGDENTFADETDVREFTVQEAPPPPGSATPLSLIAAIVVAVIAITIILGYFLRAKKST